MLLILTAIFCFSAGLLLYHIYICKIKKTIVALIRRYNHIDSSHWEQLISYIQKMHEDSQIHSNKINILQSKIDCITSIVIESIMIFDKEEKLIYYNPQTQNLFNIDSKTNERYLNEIIRSPDVIDLFSQCVRTKKKWTTNCSFIIKDKYFQTNFKVTAAPLLSEKEAVENVVLFFYDQTKIEESKRTHIDFVSNVSHELKTPLTVIQGFIEVLITDLSQKKFDQFEHFLNILLRNCKRISRLVDELLYLSNVISKSDFEKTKLDTKEITQSVIGRLKKSTYKCKIHCSFLAPYVMSHFQWLDIILKNLIENACRHAPDDSDIYIQWEKKDDCVVLKIADSGEGVPEKYRQRVFERFFKIDMTHSSKKGGSGVGLALVKQIMGKHGGSIRVVTSKNRGAEFICEFPNT